MGEDPHERHVPDHDGDSRAPSSDGGDRDICAARIHGASYTAAALTTIAHTDSCGTSIERGGGALVTSILEKLKDGVRTFQRETYPSHAAVYRRAEEEPQRPHTLMITCADSRIDVEVLTHSSPGQLFIMRNVGNIVPPYGEVLGGVSAVVEYAVQALKVGHVVICGHSDCGAMKALTDPSLMTSMPTVARWLRNAQAAHSASEALATKDERPSAAFTRLTERNVLLQLRHLKTHPSVAGALAAGALTLSGWVYEIGTGQVRIAEDGQERFEPVVAR
jgi:carbonic anhydrase